MPRKLTDEEMKARIKYYEENGKEAYKEKYKSTSYNAIVDAIYRYKHKLNIDIVLSYVEIHKRLKYYEENGSEAYAKKYNIKINNVSSAIYYLKSSLGIKIIRKEDMEITKDKKLEIIEYYKTHKVKETATHYGYTDDTMRSIASHWATELGIPTPLKRKNVKSSLTDEQKRERVEDYLQYGPDYVKRKYGYSEKNSLSCIFSFARYLKIDIPKIKASNYYSRKEMKEVLKYYEENGKEKTKKRYKKLFYKIKVFRQVLKADTNMDI